MIDASAPHSDIAQVGAWFFHMLTKGRAPELPRAANKEFVLDFGTEANVLDENLRAIITRACHPNRQHRYTSIADLRYALAAYRKPLAEQQEAAIRELTAQLPETMSATELSAARAQLEPLWLADPSEPTATPCAISSRPALPSSPTMNICGLSCGRYPRAIGRHPKSDSRHYWMALAKNSDR